MNVEAFIGSGGNAQWDMLVFKHNEHQVDACEKLARDLGFKWFRAKVSKRPFLGGTEYPINWTRPNVEAGPIDCHAVKEKSLYMDAKGKFYPCCWQPGTIEDFDSIKLSWESRPNTICKATCASQANHTNFTSQWQREVQLC